MLYMKNYTIGQVAKIVGLSAKTIRFYEDSGIISSPLRTENGYRSYSLSVLEEIKVIKYARDLGLPLSEIRKLTKGCENRNCCHPAEHIKSVITSYLALIDNKIQELNTFKTRLENFQPTLDNKNSYCCDIFHQIVLKTLNEKGGGTNERTR